MLIINGLRTEVQSVDKITNQANRGGRIHKGIHRALRFGGGVRGVGACEWEEERGVLQESHGAA